MYLLRLALLLLPVCHLAGCATADPATRAQASIERLEAIREATEAEEQFLRGRYAQIAAQLHSVESVKTAKVDAYLKGGIHPGTIVRVPEGFADAEAWRAWLETERDKLVSGIAGSEDLQIRIDLKIKEVKARNPPGGFAQSLLIR